MKKYILIIMTFALILGLSSTAFAATLYVNNSSVRDSNDAVATPTDCKVGWINSTHLWTDTDVSDYDAGDIIECISGDGENSTAIISSITNPAGSYDVVVTNSADIDSWQTGNKLNFVDLDDPADTNPFKFIKSAIDRSTASDAIEIANGTYDNGPYTLDQALTLQHTSDNFSPVLTAATAGNDVIIIEANVTPTSFNGLTFVNTTGDCYCIDQTVPTASAMTINVGNCYFAGEIDAGEAVDLESSAAQGITANFDATSAAGDNWWKGCYTDDDGANVLPTTLITETDGDGGITTDVSTFHGFQDNSTCAFTTTDHAEKTANVGTNDVEIALNKAPYEAEIFTVKRWDCAPPGNLIQPHYTGDVYATATEVEYQTGGYITISSADSWNPYTFEAEVHIQLTNDADGTAYDDYEVMRYRSSSEAGVDESDVGWVSIPGCTVDYDGDPDELVFVVNRTGTFCIVDPGANVTQAGGREMVLWLTEDNTQALPTDYNQAATTSDAYRIVFPNNNNAGSNAASWPLNNNNGDYSSNGAGDGGGTPNSDWEIDLSEDGLNPYDDMTFYLCANEDEAEFCGFDILLRWFPGYLNFSGFDASGAAGDLADALWDGGLFEEGDTGHFDNSADGYHLLTRFLDDGSGLRISVFPKTYGADMDVEAEEDTYIMKLTFDVVKPGYSPIYIEYADVRAFSSEAAPLHKFVKPYHSAYVNYLGDVADAANTSYLTGDGQVQSYDLTPFSTCYWAGITGSYVPAATYYAYKFDMGPTTNGYVTSFPVQDGELEFEDLIIFAMSFDLNTYGAQLVRSNNSIAPDIAFGEANANNRSTVQIPVLIENQVQDLRGGSFKIDYNHQALEFVSAEKGEILENTETMSLLLSKEIQSQAWCDFAVTNGAAPAINETGELMLLTFNVIGEGSYDLNIENMRLRDSGNYPMIPEGQQQEEITSSTLLQNYPNPVMGNTEIKYALKNTGKVNISVYNLLGQKVTTLVDGNQEEGEHSVSFDSSKLANGMYFYRLETSEHIQTKKMLIVR